ncbi:predicted protein [Brucella sp. 83/13]|nr:predicted protein [Brucella sp. 83/13]
MIKSNRKFIGGLPVQKTAGARARDVTPVGLQMALLIQAPGPGIEYRVLSISAGLEMKSRHSQMSSAVATEGPPAQEIRHQGSFAAHVRS